MPFKRPAPPEHANSSSSTPEPSPKHLKYSTDSSTSARPLKGVKIYIVQVKLDGSVISELFHLVESSGAKLCSHAEEADVVITAIGMRKRLERHLKWTDAQERALVTPEWLRDSVKNGREMPCGDYAALSDLHDQTVENCPQAPPAPASPSVSSSHPTSTSPSQNHLPPGAHLPSPPSSPGNSSLGHNIGPLDKYFHTQSQSSSSGQAGPSYTQNVGPLDQYFHPQHHPKFSVAATKQSLHPEASTSFNVDPTSSIPSYLLPPNPPIPTNLKKLDHKIKYSCCRASPLICPNQKLCDELNIVRKSREVEGEMRSALSYERAISMIKAYPRRITSIAQVNGLPYIGTKLTTMVEEFLNTDKIEEARTIASSPRFASLSTFTSIYGIGPQTARSLYAAGLRTLEDLEKWYDVQPAGPMHDSPSKGGEGSVISHPRGHGFELAGGIVKVGSDQRKGRRGIGKGKGKSEDVEEGREVTHEGWLKVALGLRAELELKIHRNEVEEIGRVVMNELDQVQSGCVSTVVGGYRRGKPMSNDVDIVFTHPDREKVKGLCGKFVERLYARGLVTHVMHLSGFHEHNALRTGHWDSLEKALTVFILPSDSEFAANQPDGKRRGVRRRLDLIFAMPEVYWTAVLGWTGSIMFQRDIRQWAKDKKGMKFDSSGMTRRHDSKLLFPKTEKEIFDLLDLEWIDPTLRNADA
ncbi:hypothetical protein JAAARDRAFT_37797 [Jaapia argillacea MUCL 33604]|uniref:DNA polymerase lambda n=1 Tax=Jaapia argillacea MUCL 33604 TaxID=933084 RepID=A0A067PKB3_9AGAM|nr:hypothetical protein JAAARDRAFT_37797 [Jaapia argillacea MUCL 33604]